MSARSGMFSFAGRAVGQADLAAKGAALAVGSEPGAKVFANRKVLRQLNLAVPEGAEDPTEARDKR